MVSVMGIALWLRAVRKERDWSTYDMAKAVGVSAPIIVLWQQGKRRPSVPSCIKLAAATGTPLEEIVRMAGVEEEMPRTSEEETASQTA